MIEKHVFPFTMAQFFDAVNAVANRRPRFEDYSHFVAGARIPEGRLMPSGLWLHLLINFAMHEIGH